MALAALLSLLSPPPAAAESPVFSSSFPRLFYDDSGWMDGQLSIISRYDVLNTGFYNGEGEYEVRLDSLRTLNPDLVRLAYINAVGANLPAVTDPNHVVNRLANAIDDAWYARDTRGNRVYFDRNIPHMALLNLSDQCPRAAGRTWGEFIADFAASEILASGHWDGIMWDNIWGAASWVNGSIPDSLDLNLDGIADHPDSLDVWWDRGIVDMLARFRSQVDPEVIAIGNGAGRHFPYLNGRYFEDYPFREGWSRSLQQIADWQAFGQTPSLLVPVTLSTEYDFQLMRYGVCSALTAGTFTSHYANEHPWPNRVFYDEYGVDLGQPTGDPVELNIDRILDADFEIGIPPELTSDCGLGEASWTTDPELVIDGQGSLLGLFGAAQGVWSLFVCTDPALLPLAPNSTYTVTFNYRVVDEPPGTGFFFVGAQSNQDPESSNQNALILDLPAGSVGQARGELSLGPYPDYYVYWGMKNGGTIVIDSVQIMTGRGGVFRRDFDQGMALVNPTSEPITVQLEDGYRRIAGVIDPTTNNGASVTQVTLQAEDGLVLVRSQPGGQNPPAEPPAAPPLPAVYAYPNPVAMRDTPGVSIAGVPAGGSITIFTPLGRMVRQITGGVPDTPWDWDLRSQQQRQVPAGVYLAAVRDGNGSVIHTLRLALRH